MQSLMTLLAAIFLTSAAQAAETCQLKDRRGYHPDGTSYILVELKCTDLELQLALQERHESLRVGNTGLFKKEAKREIVRDLQSVGYLKVKEGLFQKN